MAELEKADKEEEEKRIQAELDDSDSEDSAPMYANIPYLIYNNSNSTKKRPVEAISGNVETPITNAV